MEFNPYLLFTTLFLVILTRGLEGSLHGSGSSHRRPSLIPSCVNMMAKVTEAQQASLRDAAQVRATSDRVTCMGAVTLIKGHSSSTLAEMQVYAQHQRKFTNWELFRHHKANPPSDIGKQ